MKKRILSCFLALAMALSLLPMSVLAVGAGEAPIQGSPVTSQANNITVNKTVSGNQEDGYMVTMEAYAENQVTSSTTTKPLDIVLVLDVSGSMGDPISYTITKSRNWTYNDINDSEYSYYYKSGDNYYKVEADTYTSWWGTTYYQLVYTDNYGDERSLGSSSRDDASLYRGQLYIGGEIRLDALKTAVSGFIDNVAKNATENYVDHQISIVKFAGDKSSNVGNNTYPSSFGPYNYSQIVRDLTSVSSYADDLKSTVSTLEAGGATRADYGMEYAESALENARSDSQKVVVMFTDGSPTSGSNFEGEVANDAIQASKTLKDDDVIVYTIGIFEGANPDGNSNENKYMNGVSSNYPYATSYTNLGQRVSADLKYYFASDTAAGLAGVFEIISNTITSNSLTANPDEAALLSDTLSEYFDFPADVMNDGKITVQKVPVTGKNPDGSYTWGSGENITSEVTIQTVSDTLTVKGFDYKQNAVTEQGGTYSGAKLVVSFPIVPDEDACILRPLRDDYYPTNSVANGSQAGLSYKEDNDAQENTASTLLSSSPKVYLDRTNFDANGTDVTVQVFVDGKKVDDPLDYVTLTRDVRDTSYNYFQQVGEVLDGVLTYDFNYSPDEGGHDCVDIQVGIKEDATYLLQGVTSYQSHGKSGTDNVRTNTTEDPETGEKIPDGTYTVDNVTADGQKGTVDCTIYLYTKYSVAYYQDSTLLEDSYSDTNVYIAGENVASSTADDDYPTIDTPNTPVEMDWKNDGYSTSITLPSLPTVTGSTVDGWFLGSASGQEYDSSSVNVSDVKNNATDENVIQFYATSTLNEYKVTYSWTGAPSSGVTLPTDDSNYHAGDTVSVDTTYSAGDKITVDHVVYTFSGWDSSALVDGKMPANDVTISGSWSSTPETYTLTYNANGGDEGSVPTNNNTYETGKIVGLVTAPKPTHSDVNGTKVVFIGWSETQCEEIFEAGEDYGAISTSVTFQYEDITVYAVWGYDTNGDDIADATQVLIQPAAMTIYTGGNGYTGVVTDEKGDIVGANTEGNGLPEPGFYFTLPYKMDQAIKTAADGEGNAADLSQYLTITAEADDGTGTSKDRSWSIQLYDPTGTSDVNGKYVYSFEPAEGQDPVRMQFIDAEGNITISDVFEIETALYQEYVMSLYQGSVQADTVKAVVSIENQPDLTSAVGLVDSTLTIRGVTGEEVTTPIEATVSDPVKTITAATGNQAPSYYINGSQILVSNQSAVQLLVDEIVNSELEDGTKVQDALLDKAKEELPANATYEFKYLDLVDTSNGNVWVTMGKNDSLTVYWPYPDGTSKEDSFTIVHYKGLDREFDLSDLNEQNVTLEVYSTENGKLKATDQGLMFTVNSFSPFVLAYDNAEPGLSVDKSIETVNGRDYTGGRVSVGDTIGYSIVVKNTGNTTLTNVTVSDTLWTAGQTITVNGSTDSVNDDGSYVIETLAPDAFVTITYTYKVVRSDGGKTLSNTAVAEDGSGGTTGKDTEEVVVKRPSGGGDVEPPVLDTENHYGYIVGYDDGTVRPNGKITRAEVATIFFRLLTDESRDAYWCQTNDFSDVSASDWYNNAISTLTNAGILDGYEDGTFRPNGNITRAEFATIAVRFFDLTYEGEDLFPDISDHWARDYINQAAAAGFVNGYEDGTFRPNNAITRAEAVTLVNRTLERKPHKAHLLADMIQWPDNMDQTTWYYADIQEATNSHEYYMTTSEQGEEYEIWTEILPVRDWPALEKEWSDANSSTGADVTN